MKQFRRVLALVLVAATLCSFAFAAEISATVKYTDASSIKHNEAVDVLSALGIIQGYKNGSFRPTATVTRAEMAKMLAVMLNKGVDPGESFTDASTFVDALEHWGRTYIGFCVSEGLINGKSATKFDPDGKVTGTEAAKMLLCALGYNAIRHKLTGPQWESSTVGLAMKQENKLFENIDNAAIYKPLTRDDACQMMLNALKANTVDCATQGNDVAMTDNPEVGAIFIDFGHKDTFIPNATTSDYRVGGGADAVEQLCERLFQGLKLQVGTSTNVDGFPASQWNNNGKVLGVYQNGAPILSGNYNTSVGKAFDKVTAEYPKNVTVTVDGKISDQTTVQGIKDIYNSFIPGASAMSDDAFVSMLQSSLSRDPLGTKKVAGGHAAASLFLQFLLKDTGYASSFATDGDKGNPLLGWNGCHANAFYDKASETFTWACQYWYPAKITAYRPAVLDDEGNVLQKAYAVAVPLNGAPTPLAPLALNDVDIAPSSPTAVAIDTSLLDEPENIEKGMYFALYFGWDAQNAGYVVRGGTALSTATCNVTRYDASGSTVNSMRQDKSVYYRAAKTPSSSYAGIAIGKTYTLYTLNCDDKRTCFLYAELANVSAADYLYVISGGANKDKFSDQLYGANVVNMKGELSTLITNENYGVLGRDLTGGFVTYLKDANDVYTFTPAGSKGAGVVDIRNGRADVNVTEYNTLTGSPVSSIKLPVDEKTMFLIEMPDSAGQPTYTAYIGLSKVPTVSTVLATGTPNAFTYYAYSFSENGTLAAIYVGSNLVKTGAATTNYGTLFVTGEEQQQVDANSSYYPIAAIVEGKEETLKVNASLYATLGRGFYLFSSYTKNEYGIADSFDRTNLGSNGYSFTTLTEPNAGVIGFDGNYLNYTANSLCYVYSVGQKRLYKSTVDTVYAVNPTYQSFYTVNQEYPNVLATLAVVVD